MDQFYNTLFPVFNIIFNYYFSVLRTNPMTHKFTTEFSYLTFLTFLTNTSHIRGAGVDNTYLTKFLT